MSNITGKSGYIFKEGAQMKNWKKRFLVIERDKLSYYTKDNLKDKKGEILIRTIREVKSFREYKSRKYVFGIVTTTGRTYYVQGSDEENINSWINAINVLIGKGQTNGAGEQAASAGLTSNGSSSNLKANAAPTTVTTTRAVESQNGVQKQPTQAQTKEDDRKVSLDDFVQLKVIGRGGFGRVLLVKKKDSNKVYAMKVLKKKLIAHRGEIEHTRTERSVLSKLDHPFLAKLHWSFQTEDNLYFIMDFINGGELFHHLSKEKKFSEDRAKFYAAEIISGMEYLHKAGVIYRDLKPENLLLSHKGHIIMTDFGLSKEGLHTSDSRTGTFCGTPEYLAPEIIKGEDYTKAIDWWSVGTLIYEMLTGLPPFYTEDEENMYQRIMTADLVIPSHFSAGVADLIRGFLRRDPKDRLQDADDIRGHQWFSDIDWDKLEKLEINPPFVPNVESPDDVNNIDEEFLTENVEDDFDDDEEMKGPVKADAFGGFTFQANDAGLALQEV